MGNILHIHSVFNMLLLVSKHTTAIKGETPTQNPSE